MSGLSVFAITASGWLVALGIFFYARSRYHKGKADVYREFADTFGKMSSFRKPKHQRRAQSRRDYMSLALCDPLVRDGLADALADAEDTWGRFRASGEDKP